MASPSMTSGSPFVSGGLVAGKYRLIKLLGEGQMGVVWSAVNEVTSGEVALKLIWKPDQEYRVRLLREAKACGKVRHKNVIQIHDVGQTDSGDPFLVMELLSGETLAELLVRKRRLSPPEAAAIGRDIARGLAAAHAQGIVHRDLKPANIVLHNEPGNVPGQDAPVVKVLDFGVAKNAATNDGLHTAIGGVVGSPTYMSPEQARKDRDIDTRADLWSLGVVLFEMLTGERPFQGDVTEVTVRILTGEIPTVGRRIRRIDPALDKLIAGCLTRDREARLGPASEIARLLDEHTLAAAPAARGPLPSLLEEAVSDRISGAGSGPVSASGSLSPGAGAMALHPSSSSSYGAAPLRPSSSGYGSSTELIAASSPGHGATPLRPTSSGHGATPLRPSSSDHGATPLHQSGSYQSGSYQSAAASNATIPMSASPVPRVTPAPPSVQEDDAATHRLDPRHFARPAAAAPPPVQDGASGPMGTVRIDQAVVDQAIAARGDIAGPLAPLAPPPAPIASSAPVLHPATLPTNQPEQAGSGSRRKAIVAAVIVVILLALAAVVGFIVLRPSPSDDSVPPVVVTTIPSVVPAPPSVSAPPPVTPPAPNNSAPTPTPNPSDSAPPPTPDPPPSVAPTATVAPVVTATPKPKPALTGRLPLAPKPEPCGRFVKKPGCIPAVNPYDPPKL